MKISRLFIICIFLFSVNLFSSSIENIILEKKIDNKYAEEFSKLIVQSRDGRMKPLDSLNLDILNKIASKHEISSLSYNQVILGMVYTPDVWKNIPFFKIKHPRIKKILNIGEQSVSFNYMFNEKNIYKLEEQTQLANTTDEKKRNSYQKELIKLYEKVQISKFIYNNGFLKIYPLKDTNNNRWYSPLTLKENFSNEAKYEAQMLYIENKNLVNEALESGNWEEALKSVENISSFQKKYGADILPSKNKVSIELIYNDILLFEKLYGIYILFGILLFIISFRNMLKPTTLNTKISIILKNLIITAFLLHTINLLVRWYISSHAPWSDAYESMVFISWTILLAGVYFSKSSYALCATTFCSGVLLFSAHLSFIDPQITNLAPSLQSIWLTIHVAIISASYGFLALSSLLGLVAIIFFSFIKKENQVVLINNIEKVNKINELSMFLGFILLIVGTLLGSVWASESWGRVWGWDPKESWSLISILVYMLILHLRMSGKLKSLFLFAVLSFVSYSSILMTYFGVNYFFDAIHVYASNTNTQIPTSLYYFAILIGLLISFAYFRNKKLERNSL